LLTCVDDLSIDPRNVSLKPCPGRPLGSGGRDIAQSPSKKSLPPRLAVQIRIERVKQSHPSRSHEIRLISVAPR
jgi:hypothetical protein